MKDYSGSAFPCQQQETGNGDIYQSAESGMTLRDYFAAKVLQAQTTITSGDSNFLNPDYEFEGVLAKDRIAKLSYAMADAMLKAREA